MLCMECQEKPATVHIKRPVPSPPFQDMPMQFEVHFCEECCRDCIESDRILNPSPRDPDVREWHLRVMSVSSERIIVRLVSTDSDTRPEEWSLLPARVPADCAVVGTEFWVMCSESELESWRTGDRN